MSKQSQPDEPYNKRHSSLSSIWQTPPWIVEASRTVFGGKIDLDPASSAKANKIVQAESYLTKREDGLKQRWCGFSRPSSIFLNPPGGWHKGRWGDSEIRYWWAKTLIERPQKYFGHGLWLSFSIEALQVTQVEFDDSLLDFPTCVFKKRVNFIDPKTGKPVSGNTHSSSITYIPGRLDATKRFCEVFGEFGKVVVPG